MANSNPPAPLILHPLNRQAVIQRTYQAIAQSGEYTPQHGSPLRQSYPAPQEQFADAFAAHARAFHECELNHNNHFGQYLVVLLSLSLTVTIAPLPILPPSLLSLWMPDCRYLCIISLPTLHSKYFYSWVPLDAYSSNLSSLPTHNGANHSHS